MLSPYESHILALINSRPDMTANSHSVSASKTISRPDGSKLTFSYKMSVTLSKVES